MILEGKRIFIIYKLLTQIEFIKPSYDMTWYDRIQSHTEYTSEYAALTLKTRQEKLVFKQYSL